MVPTAVGPDKNTKNDVLPSGGPPNHLKYDTWASVAKQMSGHARPNDSSPITRQLQGYSRSHVCSKPDRKCHWQIAPHLLCFSDLASLYHNIVNIMISDNCTSNPAIISITTHVRGYLIKSDTLKCRISTSVRDLKQMRTYLNHRRCFVDSGAPVMQWQS